VWQPAGIVSGLRDELRFAVADWTTAKGECCRLRDARKIETRPETRLYLVHAAGFRAAILKRLRLERHLHRLFEGQLSPLRHGVRKALVTEIGTDSP
jgi:hypothetical protein